MLFIGDGLRLGSKGGLDPIPAEASTGTAVVLTLGHPVGSQGAPCLRSSFAEWAS